MPGPLPNPTRRRRNPPTIPTTNLPAAGRKGAAPKPPVGYDFGQRAAAWWRWAWKTPQAAGWSKGDLYTIARRAQLEDDLGLLGKVDTGLDLDEVLADDDMLDKVRWLIEHLKSLASSDTVLKREARELDDRLGLTPKGLAALRWKIVDDSETTGSAKKPTLAVVPPPAVDPRQALG